MVYVELFGYLFSLMIPMSPETLLDHFDKTPAVILTDFRIGPPQQSSLGEKFRDVLCEVHNQ